MLQFRVRVSLLTDIKLKENRGRLKTEDIEINGVGLTVPDPSTEEVEPSAKVTLEEDVCD